MTSEEIREKEAKQFEQFLLTKGKKSPFNASNPAEYVALIIQVGETGKSVARDHLLQHGWHALADNIDWLIARYPKEQTQ